MPWTFLQGVGVQIAPALAPFMMTTVAGYKPEYIAMQQDDYFPDDAEDFIQHRRHHPVVGIISLVLAIVVVFIDGGVFLAAVYIGAARGGAELDDNSPEALGLGLALLLGVVLAIVSITLGLAGLFLPGANKLLPSLGIGISLVIMFGVLLLTVVGMMM
jgi:hypothetical protein